MTHAEQFRQDNEEYFFTEAHGLVELIALKLADEVRYNTFRFPDGSALKIHPTYPVVESFTASQFAAI
jgi:hypothetical protein